MAGGLATVFLPGPPNQLALVVLSLFVLLFALTLRGG